MDKNLIMLEAKKELARRELYDYAMKCNRFTKVTKTH